MRADFPYLTFVHNNYFIRVLYRGKTVCDHNGRPALHQLFKRFLDQKLGFGVNICCRLLAKDKSCLCPADKVLPLSVTGSW